MRNIFEEEYNKLNSEQKEAVDSIEGPVMVIAGAGTGKTQILALRIAKILKETQIDPQNILCLTFTETGMNEMRKRLVKWIGKEGYYIKIFTFHAFCNEIISVNTEKFSFKRDYEPLDDLEKIKTFQEILDGLPVENPLISSHDRYFYSKEIEQAIKKLKQEKILPKNLKNELIIIDAFLKKIKEAAQELLSLKGTTPHETLEYSMSKINEIQCDKNKIDFIYLNHIQKTYQTFSNKLTGKKQSDKKLRTSFKNNLKHFIGKLEKDLPKQFALCDIYQKYLDILKKKNRYDFEDMILGVVEKFESDPDFLLYHQEKFQYILVDEYQDTNALQNTTVELLGKYFDSPNIFVVGDDDQSIYRFQGASIENIIEFHYKYLSSIKTITLKKNYRSQQGILDAACAMIKNNKTRLSSKNKNIDKDLQSATEKPIEKIQLLEFDNEHIENYAVLKKIEELINEKNMDPSEIAILHKKHSNAEGLIEMLSKTSIPFEVFAGIDILEDIEILKLLTFLKCIDNPNDDGILTKTLFLDFLELDAGDNLQILNLYSKRKFNDINGSLFLFLKGINNNKEKTQSNISMEKYKKLMNKLSEWKKNEENLIVTQLIQNIIHESGFLKKLSEKADKFQVLNRLKKLFDEIKSYVRKNKSISLKEIMQNISLKIENKISIKEEIWQHGRKAIKIMTAHRSKGMEFEHVFLINNTENNWFNSKISKLNLPAALAKKELEDEKIAEEEDARRLFYVTMTRAKNSLYLSYANKKSDSEKVKENQRLKFIDEIPTELIEKVDTLSYHQNAEKELEFFFAPKNLNQIPKIEESFLNETISKHRLSPTGFNCYALCPRKFLYQSLIKIPTAKNPTLSFGTAVHYALDRFFSSYNKKKIKPPMEYLILEFEKALKKEPLNDNDYKQKIEEGKILLKEYYEKKNNEFSPDTITEFNFSNDNIHLEEVPITGKIDKIEIIDENSVKLTDFKTGKAKNAIQKTRKNQDYYNQLLFYKILADASPQFKKIIKKTATEGMIEPVEKCKESKEFLQKTIIFRNNEINEMKERIIGTYSLIKNKQFDKIDYCKKCDDCFFKNLCWNKY